MIFTKRNSKGHWERIYRKNEPAKVGWYQDRPELSLKLIKFTRLKMDAGIIDVGGGTSLLPGLLLDQGYQNLSVLDISGPAINKAKTQLGEKSKDIKWIEANITDYVFAEQYDIWHDRAVFHFLTDAGDRQKYVDSLRKALKIDGHLIMATFSPDAPPKCSGLAVNRYTPETLHHELGSNFEIINTINETHTTPSGVQQAFIYCHFRRRT